MKGEAIVRVRGGGIAAVIYLVRTEQLKFDVVSTRHHGRNLRQAVLRKLAANLALRDALVFATSQGCAIRFRHGHTIQVDTDDTVLIGIDCDAAEIIDLVGGPEFERVGP